MKNATRILAVSVLVVMIFTGCGASTSKKTVKNTTETQSPISSTKATVEGSSLKMSKKNASTAERPIIKYKKIVKKKFKVVKKISEHSICNPSSGTDRNDNLDVACKLINGKDGLILDVGDDFDWFKVVGQTTAEKGFKEAGVIIDKHHAVALGGGVCQVASTLNSAAIEAGLQTKCCKHSVKVGYLSDKDYEATVSYDAGKNLTFTNTLPFPIKIEMQANGNTVTAKIYEMDVKETWIFREIKD